MIMILLFLAGVLSSACERDTRLEIVSGEPLKFILLGRGSLVTLRVHVLRSSAKVAVKMQISGD
jgi:hypothetical protein